MILGYLISNTVDQRSASRMTLLSTQYAVDYTLALGLQEMRAQSCGPWPGEVSCLLPPLD